MTDKALEERLRSALTRETFERDLPERVKRLARDHVQPPRRERIGFPCFVLRLIRFTGVRVWLFQGAAITVLLCLFRAVTTAAERRDPRFVAFLLCCLTCLALMTSLPALYKSRLCRMQAVEAATLFSTGKLFIGRIVVYGIGNVLMSITLCIAAHASLPSLGTAVLYVLFPSVLTIAGLAALLSRGKPEHLPVGGMTLCGALILGFLLLYRLCPAFFAQSLTLRSLAACAVPACFAVSELRRAACRVEPI